MKTQEILANITKGTWEINSQRNLIKCDKKWVADASVEGFEKVSAIEQEANCELILDAGDTSQECGLLPSELLKQRNELLVALYQINGHIADASNVENGKVNSGLLANISISAIKSCTKKQ